MRNMQRVHEGFTLPTVVVASVAMLAMLLMSFQLSAASSNALRDQYYNQLAREAAESGLAHAQLCLSRSNEVAQWSNDTVNRTLTPATDCSGVEVAGASQYVIDDDLIQTSYTVGKPSRIEGLQRVPVDGKVELKRVSDGQTYKSYNYALQSQAGASTVVNSVAFGYDAWYCSRPGAFFATVDEFGVARGTGLNACGQLGNSNNDDTLVPTVFPLSSGKKASRVFTNFLSLGQNLFVLTTDGEVWGSGKNQYGQLGNGSVETNQTTPVRFILPSDDNEAVFVAPLGWTTFVVTSQGNIYAAGNNEYGNAGVGSNAAAINGSPVKVPLPDGEKARASMKSWSVDRSNAYVITESGKVYGWGENYWGQLGQQDTSNRSSPVQLKLPGNVTAEQVTFEGDTIYIRGSNGRVFSAGKSTFGQTGTRYARLRNSGLGGCLTAKDKTLVLEACNEKRLDQLWSFEENGTLRVQGNDPDAWRCVDNVNWSNLKAGVWDCSVNTAKLYEPSYPCSGTCIEAMRIVNTHTGSYCLQGQLFGDSRVGLSRCSSSSSQYFYPYDSTIREITFPDNKRAIDISTDQWFGTAVMEDGSVYTWGLNNGAFGNDVLPTENQSSESLKYWNPGPVRYGRFGDPGYPRAVSSWTTSNGLPSSRSNIFVTTDDGKVFGTGSNLYGQLGIGSISPTSIATPRQMNVFGSGSNFAKYVRSGYGTTVIYTSYGKVYTVGNNANGQLGDGTKANSSMPKANIYTNVGPSTYLQY